jgi:Hypothetical glycosyl hydrolase 6
MRSFALFFLMLLVAPVSPSHQGWWMDEPIRLIQTNLRETDSTLDVQRLARQVSEFRGNVLLFNMGGIVAQYPTQVEFHYPSPHLPLGRDLFGEMLKQAHARGIRVIGRFDLSKTQKAVYDAHPEWFFKSASGEPAIYNGLYSACINGGYYHQHAKKILTEALERYEVDGLFFNMFENPSSDYSGNPMGPCHCDSCQASFRSRYGRPVPATADDEYRDFLASSAREVAAMIAELIRAKRPKAAFLTYIQQHTDGIVSESNTSVSRPLPLWPYSASDNVNRARNSEPSKMAFNLCMGFVDYPWRFATVPQAEIRLRLYQSMAHGSGVLLNMHGTMDQEDQSALAAAKPVFEWHASHEDLYVGQESAARVLLVGSRQLSYRGFFRILSEHHVPFAVSDNLKWLEEGRQFDLVISPDGASAELENWVRRGGRLLIAGSTLPRFELPGVLGRRPHTQGYWRVRAHTLFPSLQNTQLIFFDGEYVALAATDNPLLTLIPPAMFGPPEKVWVDKKETDMRGLLLIDYGQGRVAYVPWDVGALYYRHSSEAHAGLVIDLVDHLLPQGRQLKTEAHPLVEITVMRQPRRHRTLVHLVNLSGHSQTGYFAPITMSDIALQLAEKFRRARSVTLNASLPVKRAGRYGKFSVPKLDGYDVVVLE